MRVITAVILAAELGDFAGFASAPALMAYLELVPSEHASGETQKRGRITRTGNSHVRRILVESAWSYRQRRACAGEKLVFEAIARRIDEVGPRPAYANERSDSAVTPTMDWAMVARRDSDP